MGECRFERLAMIWMRRRGEFVLNSRTRELQILALLLALNLLRGLVAGGCLLLWGPILLDLGFDVLAFPTTRHTHILTQN